MYERKFRTWPENGRVEETDNDGRIEKTDEIRVGGGVGRAPKE